MRARGAIVLSWKEDYYLLLGYTFTAKWVFVNIIVIIVVLHAFFCCGLVQRLLSLWLEAFLVYS